VKVPGPATKPLLRALLEGRVPREAWDRPKHGFTAPVARWLREELRDCVEARLFSEGSLGRALFDPRGVRRLWNDHLVGRADHTHELWMLLMLETWHARLVPAPVEAA
jgi:asparagine synthase (glutamine-hydrolysing)